MAKTLYPPIGGAILVVVLATLLARGAPAEGERIPVALNHFYLTVDSATYADIGKSGFLRNEFGAFEQRTTVRADRTYTGAYFYGAHTYFEFFDASTQGQPVYASGVAFGVESSGNVERLRRALEGKIPVMVTTITRQLEGVQIPWFVMLAPGAPDGLLRTWVMEYLPRFLAEWHGDATPARGIARSGVLERYKAVLKIPASQRLLEDVTGLTLALPADELSQFAKFCGLLGLSLRADAGVTRIEGPALVMRLVPESADTRGIRELTFRVRGAPAEREHRFGPRSVLRFVDPNTAVWSF